MKRKAVFLASTDNKQMANVFEGGFYGILDGCVELYPEPADRDTAELHAAGLRDVEIAFATWGIPHFTEAELERYLPNLKLLCYAAGSVQAFARPFLSRGVRVASGWAANAIPVAEYTTAQIVLANKGFYQTSFRYKRSHREASRTAGLYPGNFGARVGILGAGMIGRKVIEKLRDYNVRVEVFDPFLPDDRAAELGVEKAELVDIFSRCDTISNHLANLPATVGILHKEHFDRMLPHATFINTGRGAQVVEADLIRALREVPTRTAVLDVTFPEPVGPDSELLTLDNVVLTPHIAGSKNREVARMGHYMAEECVRYINGEPLRYGVTLDMLETMA